MSLWLQSIQSPFDVNQVAFAHKLISSGFESKSQQIQRSTQLMDNQTVFRASTQRPGSSCSLSSNSSESTIVPPIHNKNYQESRYKTELCRHFQEVGNCPHGSQCLFAHGINELKPFRGRHRKFRTQLCKAFHSEGFCSYGPRCSYIHTSADLPLGAILPATALNTKSFPNERGLNLNNSLEFGFKRMAITMDMTPLEAPAHQESLLDGDCRLNVFSKICEH